MDPSQIEICDGAVGDAYCELVGRLDVRGITA
jgi:hypothetical protein